MRDPRPASRSMKRSPPVGFNGGPGLSSAQTRPRQIETGFLDMLDLLDSHLAGALSVWRTARAGRISAFGADLRCDRSDGRRHHWRRRAACAELGTACFGRRPRASLRPGPRWSRP
jgi:hypothetical protein